MSCTPRHKFRFHNPLYAIDSRTIDLCLNLYNWTHYHKNKRTVKLHTELDLSGNLPCFVMLSNGKMANIRAARENFVIVPDCTCIFDKGCCRFLGIRENAVMAQRRIALSHNFLVQHQVSARIQAQSR